MVRRAPASRSSHLPRASHSRHALQPNVVDGRGRIDQISPIFRKCDGGIVEQTMLGTAKHRRRRFIPMFASRDEPLVFSFRTCCCGKAQASCSSPLTPPTRYRGRGGTSGHFKAIGAMLRKGAAATIAAILWYKHASATEYNECVNGTVEDIGDGRCDVQNNNSFCGFDGGDCCPCTCTDGPLYSCVDNNFDECEFPDCDQSDQAYSSHRMECIEDRLGDGLCDPDNNHPFCDYDGGDCCACSCIDGEVWNCGDLRPHFDTEFSGGRSSTSSDFFVNLDGFDCRDPACLFDPTVVADFPNCTGDWLTIGDGSCSAINNNPECDYDGGDCCLCTCDSPDCCTTNDLECLDPSAHEEFYGCKAPPPAAQPCSADAQRSWVVQSSRQAQDLATSVNCSGGYFEVDWRGHALLDEPIYVVDGTVLNVTGADSAATVGGNFSRLFVVVNASLNLSGLRLLDGVGILGGAIAASGSVVTIQNTTIEDNVAHGKGGGLYASESSVFFDGVVFSSNTAAANGGAMYISDGSNLSSAVGTSATFTSNSAFDGHGGGAYLTESKVHFGGSTEFVGNEAGQAGGAAHVTAASDMSWSGDMLISNNSCIRGGGGGIFILNGSTVSWTGDTEFSGNYAATDGGAVASPTVDSVHNPQDSALVMGGRTTFSRNKCYANGGGLALLGACSVSNAAHVNFVGNDAAVAGGAMFLSGSAFGPCFTDVSFVMNSAQVGGAVSSSGSGNAKNTDDFTPPCPTTFDRCWFIDNRARATGGAIESAAGQDEIANSIFRGNAARVGGALRLAGTAAFHNCTLEKNSSEDGEGAAVSNIGVIRRMDSNYFAENAFVCPEGMYLEYTTASDPHDAVCRGCPPGDHNSVFEPNLSPACVRAIDHSTSRGGNTTLETLSIDPGYWRATEFSTDVLPCYRADACLGGVTGRADYCREGYEGPYCAVCNSGYCPQLGFSCATCSDSVGGVVFAAVVVALVLLVAVAVVSYLMPGDGGGPKLGLVARIARHVPLQSVKIVIVSWQILTQFTSVANVAYPDVYQRLLDVLDVFNFDLGWVLSAGCVIDIDFHDRLLIVTIGPIIGVLFLAATYAIAAYISRAAPETIGQIWNKHVFMVLLLAFLIYSSVSSVLFKTFACEELHDGKTYLRADYRIECDSSKHEQFEIYAAFMILVYAVGIPVFFGVLLFKDREVWGQDEAAREEAAPLTPTSDLWRPYKRSVFYYEVVECCRRILLTGVVVFVYPNTSAQIAVTLMLAFLFLLISEVLDPYMSKWDTWISRMGHVVVFMSMYIALLLKVDVSKERTSSQRVFEIVLVSVHACMLLVVVVETVFVACSLRAEQREARALKDSRRSIMPITRQESQVTLDESNPYPGLPRIF
ncbi:unnamed protein product [Scytosiphon promiscuus]